MAKHDCDYSRPGIAPWWSCCTEEGHVHHDDTPGSSTG